MMSKWRSACSVVLQYAAEDTTGFTEQVERLLGSCCQWRDKVESEAVQLAHSCTVPARPVVYWIQKYLEVGATPVEFPCVRVELHIPTLGQATSHSQVSLVTAVLQAVHSKHYAPNAPVRILARCCLDSRFCMKIFIIVLYLFLV
jgi:hypothetical protein